MLKWAMAISKRRIKDIFYVPVNFSSITSDQSKVSSVKCKYIYIFFNIFFPSYNLITPSVGAPSLKGPNALVCMTASVDFMYCSRRTVPGKPSLSSSPVDGAPPRQAWTILCSFVCNKVTELGS